MTPSKLYVVTDVTTTVHALQSMSVEARAQLFDAMVLEFSSELMVAFWKYDGKELSDHEAEMLRKTALSTKMVNPAKRARYWDVMIEMFREEIAEAHNRAPLTFLFDCRTCGRKQRVDGHVKGTPLVCKNCGHDNATTTTKTEDTNGGTKSEG